MTTADWAFVVSLCSFVLSLAAFVWNVWSKFIYPKPRVLVGASIMSLLNEDGTSGEECFTISATNFGPVEVILQYAIAYRGQWFWKKKSRVYALLQPYHNWPHSDVSHGPISGGLPKKLAVGEQFSSRFPVSKKWFEKDGWDLFGFQDTFGRRHYCSRKGLARIKKDVLKPQPPAD